MKTSIITRTAILIAVALITFTTLAAVATPAQAKPHIKCLRWVGFLSTGRHCTKWIIVP